MQRMTYSVALVLQALERGFQYGFDIIEATGLRSGTVYPILRRLARGKLVRAHWEPVARARAENRPPRRYYELTDNASSLLELAKDRYPLTEGLMNSSGDTVGA